MIANSWFQVPDRAKELDELKLLPIAHPKGS